MSDPSAAFEKAVAHISSSNVAASNDVKLELYANYKIATTAVTPQSININRPGMFDFAGRAKYDAWARLGAELGTQHQGKTTDELAQMAKTRYIELAKQKFGFDDTQDMSILTKPAEEREKTADELLDEDEEDSQPPPSAASTGGMSVSTMTMPAQLEAQDNEQWRLHDLATRGDIEGIKALQPTVQELNALDANGFAPIHLAADKGHAQVVRLLLKLGADPDQLDSEGMSAMDTAEAVENEEIINLLKSQAP